MKRGGLRKSPEYSEIEGTKGCIDYLFTTSVKDSTQHTFHDDEHLYSHYIATMWSANGDSSSVVFPNSFNVIKVSVYNQTTKKWDEVSISQISGSGFKYQLLNPDSYQNTYGDTLNFYGII